MSSAENDVLLLITAILREDAASRELDLRRQIAAAPPPLHGRPLLHVQQRNAGR